MQSVKYDDPVEFSIENALEKIERLLQGSYAISKRTIGLLLLQDDKDIGDKVRQKEKENFSAINTVVEETKKSYNQPLDYIVAIRRQKKSSAIINHVMEVAHEKKFSFGELLSQWTMTPVTGIPILFFVLYLGLYKFVGEFGAGTVVDFLEEGVFETHINPFVTEIFTRFIPWKIIQELFVGEYGTVTLGLRYALALILPIVTFFFIVFSIIEDSGYLPRLAMLIDRVFKMIGLSGRAVIPMVLGFGCSTMATMVTRTLPTKRERIITTLLLSLTIPCSAQLGVIIALLAGRPAAMSIWAGVMVLVFLFIGYLTALVLPGTKPTFYMEVPPLRFPKFSNVLVKTYTRVAWYLKEVLPLFILASVFIWIGQVTKFFDLIIYLLKKPVDLIGLPPEAAKIFLFGFFRRDYGAAGLYDLEKQNLLTGTQLTVASIALTLFLPCIAQFLMNIKERGLKTGVSISLFVLFFSFTIAFLVNFILTKLGVAL